MAPPSTSQTASNGVSLANLQLNDHGLRSLRLFLGKDDTYRQYQERFDAADLAWFVAGAHRDGDHQLHPNTFHPLWKTARLVDCADPETSKAIRNELRRKLKNLLLDTAAMLDRSQGGCTMILHVDGPLPPGVRPTLENVKIDVGLAPHFLQEIPNVERPLAEIVQKFAESLGAFTVYRWRVAFENAGNKLSTPFADNRGTRPIVRPFMPNATPYTNHFVCYGRPVGQLNDMLQAVGITPSPPAASQPPSEEVVRVANTVVHDNEGDDLDDCGPIHGQREAILEQCIAGLEMEIAEKDHLLDERDKILEEKDQALEEKDNALATKDQVIRDLERQLMARDLILAEKVRIITEQSRVLQTREEDLRQLRLQLLGPPPGLENVLPSRPDRDTGHSLGGAPLAAPATPTPSVASGMRSRVGTPVPFLSHLGEGGRAIGVPSPTSARAHGSMSVRFRRDDNDDVSERSSTVISMSDWSGTLSPPPTGAVTTSEWEMPSYPLMGSSAQRAPQSPVSAASPRRPVRASFRIVGPATDAVLNTSGIMRAFHRELLGLIDSVPEDEWVSVLFEQYGLSEVVAQRLVAAIAQDVPSM